MPRAWRISLFEAMRGGSPRAGGADLLRLDPLNIARRDFRREFFRRRFRIYLWRRSQGFRRSSARSSQRELRARLKIGLQLARPDARIRATVIGASQYTMQVSGSTIFVSPLETLPLRNVPVIAPDLPLGEEKIDPAAIAAAIKAALKRLDLGDGESAGRGLRAVARLGDVPAARRFLQRRRRRLGGHARHGHPIVLAGDGDVGGLIGIHYCEEMKFENPIVSIDGLELKEFDYIDIGAILDTSGAVPVVIKSLVFPTSAGVGRDWEAEPVIAARSVQRLQASAIPQLFCNAQ